MTKSNLAITNARAPPNNMPGKKEKSRQSPRCHAPNADRTPTPTVVPILLPVQGVLSYSLAITNCITHQAVQRHSCSAFARFVLGLELHAGAGSILSIVYPNSTGIHSWRRMEDSVGWGSATGLFAVVFGLNQHLSRGNRRRLDSTHRIAFLGSPSR